MYWQLFKLIKTNYLRNKARVGYLKIIVAVPCKAVLYNLSFHLVYFALIVIRINIFPNICDSGKNTVRITKPSWKNGPIPEINSLINFSENFLLNNIGTLHIPSLPNRALASFQACTFRPRIHAKLTK
jgi:hypothetical protein